MFRRSGTIQRPVEHKRSAGSSQKNFWPTKRCGTSNTKTTTVSTGHSELQRNCENSRKSADMAKEKTVFGSGYRQRPTLLDTKKGARRTIRRRALGPRATPRHASRFHRRMPFATPGTARKGSAVRSLSCELFPCPVDSATTTHANCPHLGHIERIPGPRSPWRARRRSSLFLFFLLLHTDVPGGNGRAPFPGSANDFPAEHRSEGEVRPFLGRFCQLPSFLEVHPGLCLLAADPLHALRR